MSADAPTVFWVGILVICTLGVLLPLRLDDREDHIVLTVGATVAGGAMGAQGVILVWGALALGAPLIVGWAVLGRRFSHLGWHGAGQRLKWAGLSAASITVGFVCAVGVYTAVLDGTYPVRLDTLDGFAKAGVQVTVAWVGTMSLRLVSLRWLSGALIRKGLDPIDSPLIPYLIPLMAGFPLVTASVALYDPLAPWPSILILWWCLPIYVATAIDLHRRQLAQDLRRDALAQQRLAAIGEVSARIVHQSRHQVGLMGWSIHRLRGLLGRSDPTSVALANAELDAVAEAKENLSRMLASELLHEAPAEGDGSATTPTSRGTGRGRGQGPARTTAAELVADVAARLADEARREGVRIQLRIDDAAGDTAVATELHDAVFNLVDNAIDAARLEVTVEVTGVGSTGSTGASALEIRVGDDGDGFGDLDPARLVEPFFTTKSDGTGMGLAIADAVIADVGGALTYERSETRTVFTVRLPVANSPVDPPRVTTGP